MSRRTSYVLLATLTLSGAPAPAAPPAAAASNLPPRVILVTIDTLRADRLPMYGYPRQTAPFLSSLADNGVTYKCVIAASSHTGPCHASLFTSRYPDEHGLLMNGQRMSADGATLAELFAAQGYKTAAFSSVVFLRQVMRGFEVQNLPDQTTTSTKKPRRGDKTVDEAIAWAKSQPAKSKYFIWVHVYDVHNSRDDDHEFADWGRRIELEKDAPDPRRVWLHWVHREGIPASRLKETRLALRQASYDARIRFVDDQLRRLHDAVSGRGAPPSLWMVTADHGEGLGSHGHMGHGPWIYEEQTRIPLIASFSDGRQKGKRVGGLVRQVDVMPSLCAGLGLPRDPAWEGAPVFPFGKRTGFESAFVTRRPSKQKEKSNWKGSRRYALRGKRWKLIWSESGEPQELFDLRRDPLERTNLAGKLTDRVDGMSGKIRRIVERVAPAGKAVEPEPIDPEDAEELKSLGYLQ